MLIKGEILLLFSTHRPLCPHTENFKIWNKDTQPALSLFLHDHSSLSEETENKENSQDFVCNYKIVLLLNDAGLGTG